MELIWFLLGGLGILLLGILFLVFIIFYRISNKSKIRVNILMKARRWMRFKVKLKKVGTGTIKVKDSNTGYVFDDRGIIKGKYIDDIYYFEGNPEPIMLDFQSNVPKTQAKDLQTILDSDLIEKLFSEKRLAKMEMLLIIILILVVLGLFACIGNFFVPANIQTDGNAQWILNITQTAIRGI